MKQNHLILIYGPKYNHKKLLFSQIIYHLGSTVCTALEVTRPPLAL